MLIKGSSRVLKDNNGFRPLDIISIVDVADQSKSVEVADQTKSDLQSILGKQPLSIPCSQIRPPLAKINKSFITFSMYVFLYASTYILL